MPLKIKLWWNSLPLWAKITLKSCAVAFIGGASGVVRHSFVASHGCLTEHCILEYLWSGVHVGGVAVGAYLMNSPFAKKIEAQLPPVQN
jgi:hypothetical protein